MKLAFFLLLLMILSIVAEGNKEAKEAEGTKAKSLFSRMMEKVPSHFGSIAVNGEFEVSDERADLYREFVVLLESAYKLSDDLKLEEEVFKVNVDSTVLAVLQKFKLELSKNKNGFDDQIKWNFKTIIGIQMTNWKSFKSFPRLHGLLPKAMTIWRQYLNIAAWTDDCDEQMKGIKEKLQNMESSLDVYKEIATHVSNEMTPPLKEDELSEFRQVVQLKIVEEVLLSVVPEKQKFMFVILLKYFEQGVFNEVYESANKRMDEKLGSYSKKGEAENSEPQSSNWSPDSDRTLKIFIDFYSNWNTSRTYSQQLNALEKVMAKQEIQQLITEDILAKHPRLKWRLESLISIEANIRDHIRREAALKPVFDYAVKLWKDNTFNPNKALPSTPIGDPEAEFEKTLELTMESATSEIIQKAAKQKEIELEVAEWMSLCKALEYKMSLYLMFSIVPKQEGLLLRKVSWYFENEKFDDIAVELFADKSSPSSSDNN